MPFLRSLTWIRTHLSNVLLDHSPMIMIVSGKSLDRMIPTENPDQREWFTNSLCEKPCLYFLQESVPDLRDLVVI